MDDTVTAADRECMDLVQACLRTATELRTGGTLDETRQAMFWEGKACEAIARHRTQSDNLREALEEIAELTKRKQLPLTSQINAIARKALESDR